MSATARRRSSNSASWHAAGEILTAAPKAVAKPKPKPRRVSAQRGARVLYTVLEVAKVLGCSDMHVYRQISAGQLHAIDIATPGAGRRKTRIRHEDLTEYINRLARPEGCNDETSEP